MDSEARDIWVVGHQNPDTDSICSAIAYAYLKGKISDRSFVPKRAGEVNQETAYVLSEFGVDFYIETGQAAFWTFGCESV